MEFDISDKCVLTAKQAAVAFHKRNRKNLELNELISEAYMIMIDAVTTWEMDKGRNLYSWIGFMVHRELRKRFSTSIIFSDKQVDYIQDINTINTEQIYLEKEKINSLSELSKYILNMIYTGEIVTKDQNKNSIKKAIKLKLKNKGYTSNKIRDAFTELKKAAYG